MCNCIKITYLIGDTFLPTIVSLYVYGQYNDKNYYRFYITSGSFTGYYYLYYNDSNNKWEVSKTLGGVINGGDVYVISLAENLNCPPIGDESAWEIMIGFSIFTTSECIAVEDRQKFEYKSIKLPSSCGNEDRGIEDCCCDQLVLAKATSNSWETDKTSAWLKLSAPGDSVEFKLYKNGIETIFTPSINEFQNTSNAFYTTINWIDVLNSDGIGCYELKVEYEISGIQSSFTWGYYKLLPFTVKNALKTARIRAFFNAYHEIEQIDFTGSNVESTFRFYGYIGNRQPNTEIDNIIYGNREMKRVIRENLNEYEIYVDPSLKCITKPLIDLYFLSENELFISDYNAHNHDYCINDLPVIVSESPELTYYDFSRKASIKCIVSDKFKNQRTYY